MPEFFPTLQYTNQPFPYKQRGAYAAHIHSTWKQKKQSSSNPNTNQLHQTQITCSTSRTLRSLQGQRQKWETFTSMAMIKIGAANTIINGDALYMWQDSGASINGVDLFTTQHSGLNIIKLQHPWKHFLEMVMKFKQTFQFSFNSKLEITLLPCHVMSSKSSSFES